MRQLRFAWIRFLRNLRRTRTTHFKSKGNRYRRIP